MEGKVKFIRALTPSHRADQSPVKATRTGAHEFVLKTVCDKRITSLIVHLESRFYFGGISGESVSCFGVLFEGWFRSTALSVEVTLTVLPLFYGPLCVIARETSLTLDSK